METINVSYDSNYVHHISALKYGHVAFVNAAVIKTDGNTDFHSMASGLPKPYDEEIVQVNVTPDNNAVRLKITTNGELSEHWSPTWTCTSGNEINFILTYICK